jgi:RHS repeat-associated protein
VDQDGTTYQFLPSIGSGQVVGYCCAAGSLATSITDRNGNTITLNSPANGYGLAANAYTDTVGREVVSWSGLGSSSGDTLSISGLSNITVHWTTVYTGNYAMGSQPLPGNQSPNCQVPSTGPSSSQLGVSEIDLPNNTKYAITYDSENPLLYDANPSQGPYGVVGQINFPDGGYVRYKWGLDTNSQGIYQSVIFNTVPAQQLTCILSYDAPAVVERIVNDGTRNVLDQTFSYGPTTWGINTWKSKSTTVTTTDLVTGQQTITKYTYSASGVDTPPWDTGSQTPVAPVETTTVYEDGSGNTVRTVNQQWLNYMTASGNQTVFEDNQTTRTALKCFDANDQVTQFYEYGLPSEGSYPGDPSCVSSSGLTASKGPLKRQTITVTSSQGSCGTNIVDEPCSITVEDGSGNEAKQTVFNYTDSVQPSNVSCSGCLVSPPGQHRGNVGSVVRAVNGSSSLPTNYTYYGTGQVASMTDPNGNTTTYCYGDTSAGCPSGNTYGYLTQVTYPSTNGVSHIEEFSWNLANGKLASSIDENGQTSSYSYNDPLARLTQVTYPSTPGAYYNGSSCTSPGQTSYSYNDAAGAVSVATSKLLCNGVSATSTAYLNGLGLTTKTIAENGAETDTVYDGLRRVYQVSNPYFTSNDPTYGWTTTLYDPLGRVTSVTKPDQSVVSTSYSANCTTVKDENGRPRRSCTDGLARTWQVTEDPGGLGYVTTYQHDPNDNLTGVNQSGQLRSFSYDWLSRLTSATNPESGTTTYTYPTPSALCSGDPSTVCTRQDNRGITTTYLYDALNRPTSKRYSDGTPSANFFYDEASVSLGSWTSPALGNPIGRQTHTTTTSGGTTLTATVQSYDPMGRTTNYWQCTPLNCGTSRIWPTSYTYDLAGDLSSWIHPSQFTITQTLNAAQQVTAVKSSLSSSTQPPTLAQSITYNAPGAVTGLQNGCAVGSGSSCMNVQETYQYNNRLQVAMAELGTPSQMAPMAELGTASSPAWTSCRVYNYYLPSLPGGEPNPTSCAMPAQGTNNNGNVAGMYYSDSANSGLSHTASYNYDGVNRLSGAAATGNSTYSQSYTYDPYGNMTCAASPAENKCIAPTYSASTNQITTSGYAYDAAGDLQNDGTYTYQWDAEARLAKVISSGTAISTNTYNALGQRVRDVTTTSTTDEAYGAGGNLLWRYTGNPSDPNQRAFVPFNGRILAEYYAGVTIFDHPDEIGSMTTSSDYTGKTINEKLFYPFGELWTGAAIPNLNMHQTFAQLPDYDSETDQYNTANRHYSPSGRWLSPDPGGVKVVKLDDPQTWNMYAYVRNNPTTSTDPTGLACIFGMTIFGSHFGGRCPGDEPPPPPRRPPPPAPAVMTPGTPQYNLASAQAAARSNPAFRPTGVPGTPGRTTHCNEATCAIAEDIGASTNGLVNENGVPNSANTDATTLANSPDWRPATPQEAQQAGNQGVLALGARPDDPRGHILSVAPELMPGLHDVGRNGPQVNQIGATVGIMNAYGDRPRVWTSPQGITWYVPWDWGP